MTNKFLDKKIPTALGMTLIIMGLSITTLLTNRQTVFQIGAQVNTQPQEVRITNLSDTSFTITYTTISPTSGFVNYGLDKSLGQTSFDEKDAFKKLQNHTVHSIRLNSLSPSTKYYFSIKSGDETYLNNNQHFEVKTAPTFDISSLSDSISGKIILPDSSPPKEAIVYIKSDNTQALSTLVSNDGSYKINLNNLLNASLTSPLALSNNSTLQILVLGDSLTSSASIYYFQKDTMPTITLTNNYDFRENLEKTSSNSATPNGFPSFKNASLVKPVNKNLEILTPKENQTVNSQTPDLKGTALPNQDIQITIHSKELIETSVTTDANGNWSYQPTTSLEPGVHTITVSAKDSTGKIKTIAQTFTVDGSLPTPTPTITPTPSIDYENSTTSAVITKQPLPIAGNTSIIAAAVAGLLISITGGFIFLLSHKGI